jgi:tripartite-type tricarboxylate transporter receptor subunit TctC
MLHHFSFIGPILILVIILGLSKAPAEEKGYPNKPITIVIEYPVGGGSDVACRALANEMQSYLGQPVLVESKPGASGIIAGNYVAKAKPDGYIISAFTSTACDPDLYSRFRKASYSTQDLKPIVRYLAFPYALFSNKNVPWKNLQELVKYVKDNPNRVRWGHLGVGHRYHLLGVALSKANKLEMIPVPFKGASDVVVAVLGGHIEVGIGSVASVSGQVQAGRIMILGIQHPTRVSYMREIPTFKELGYDLGLAPYYVGLFAPKGTPEEVVNKIHDSVKWAIETPSLKDFANKAGFELYYGSASDLISEMKKDREVIGGLIEDIIK